MPSKPTHLAASSGGNVKFNDFAVAPTISKMERDATREVARAFYEFWSTGDEALLKTALVESFADRVVQPPRAPTTFGTRPGRRLGTSETE